MNTSKYLKILKDEIHSTAIATIDDEGLPQVRIIDIMLVDEDKLYFITARGKEFYGQLIKDQYVAITGTTHGDVGNSLTKKAISIRGKVKSIGGELLDRVFKENPYMNDIYPEGTRHALEVFCLYEGSGEFFDLTSKPIFREAFTFGKTDKKKIFYEIYNECIGCGRCLRSCPQKCIEESLPFIINQNHCLHCGICEEFCPVNAIKYVNN